LRSSRQACSCTRGIHISNDLFACKCLNVAQKCRWQLLYQVLETRLVLPLPASARHRATAESRGLSAVSAPFSRSNPASKNGPSCKTRRMAKRLRAWENPEGAGGAAGNGPAAQTEQSLFSAVFSRLPAFLRGAEHETSAAKKLTPQLQPPPPGHKLRASPPPPPPPQQQNQPPCFVYDLEGRS